MRPSRTTAGGTRSSPFNYVARVAGNLRAQLQVSTGYGETLVDYNHAQTTVGLGLAFVAW